MNTLTCTQLQLLLQADVDGELSPAEAARIGEHLEDCPDCAALPAQLAALSAALRGEAPYHRAPDTLRSALRVQLATIAPPASAPARRGVRPLWPAAAAWLRARTAVPFGAGFALAACLALALVHQPEAGLTDAVVAGHIRALQPGHLLDVASTDQHTVKPWFDGRLDFAPPVKDLKQLGFPLTGGRLDYLDGRPVAVLVYGRRQHVIDVFIWPEHGGPAPLSTRRNGYNVVRWTEGEMTFWAVSDLDPGELAEFARALRP